MEDQILHDSQQANIYDDNIEVQYIISTRKFIILSILSFGLYPVWWMYKSWRFFQEKDRLDIMPAARALFSLIFLYFLLDKILTYAKQKNYTENYSPGLLFIMFLGANVFSNIPYCWLLSLASTFALIPAFNALNYAKLHSIEFEVKEQHQYNTRQIILMVIGGILWLLVVMNINDAFHNDAYQLR